MTWSNYFSVRTQNISYQDCFPSTATYITPRLDSPHIDARVDATLHFWRLRKVLAQVLGDVGVVLPGEAANLAVTLTCHGALQEEHNQTEMETMRAVVELCN